MLMHLVLEVFILWHFERALIHIFEIDACLANFGDSLIWIEAAVEVVE